RRHQRAAFCILAALGPRRIEASGFSNNRQSSSKLVGRAHTVACHLFRYSADLRVPRARLMLTR
ncbi:hypothetical protein, partial [Verrucomicrobium spinosum]|uniref:hypothetical protein n=1 Tax=Verrucomicrobium spinosum TaxID=2736 RepID=UPI001C4758AD